MSSGIRQQDDSGKCERRNLHGCFFVCLIESLELNVEFALSNEMK